MERKGGVKEKVCVCLMTKKANDRKCLFNFGNLIGESGGGEGRVQVKVYMLFVKIV